MAAAPGKTRDLTSGPILGSLIVFALPTLASNILQSLNGSINAVWVGRFLGEEALAATSNANIVFFLMISLMFGFGMAATILVGQAWGRGDRDAARRAAGTSIGMLSLGAVVIAIAGHAATPTILRWMATPAPVVPLAEAYMRTLFLAMPAQFAGLALIMSLRGSGDSTTPFFSMLFGAVLDAGLNPVFILGLGPAPRLGIAGAGVATAVAGWVNLAATIGYIYARDLPLRLRGEELRYLLPDPRLLRIVAAKGVPMGLQMIVMAVSSIIVIGAVNAQGVLTMAAYGVTTQLITYVQMPAMAIGAAVSAMAAQNIGAGKWDRVERITRSAAFLSIAVTTTMVILITAVDRLALGLFIGENSPAIPIAQHIQRIITWSFIPFGVTLILFGTVRANGAVVPPLIILIVSTLILRLGALHYALPRYGADGIWWTQPVGVLAAVIGAAAYYRWGNWRKARMMAPPRAGAAAEQSIADGEPAGRIKPAG